MANKEYLEKIWLETATLSNVECEIEDLQNLIKHLECSLAITRELLKERLEARDYLEKGNNVG